MYLAASQTGVSDNGTLCDGNLEFMARKSVHPNSRVNGKILEEPSLTDLQILNTSKEDPLIGTIYLGSLQ